MNNMNINNMNIIDKRDGTSIFSDVKVRLERDGMYVYDVDELVGRVYDGFLWKKFNDGWVVYSSEDDIMIAGYGKFARAVI